VARQYCGQLGKQDNCQVAVSLSLANHHASLPVAFRLYLPQNWADDHERRRKAGVPAEVKSSSIGQQSQLASNHASDGDRHASRSSSAHHFSIARSRQSHKARMFRRQHPQNKLRRHSNC
jgi:hypothetical protein